MKNLTKIFMAVVAGMFAFSCVTDTTVDQGVQLGNEANGGQVVKTTLSVELANSQELRTQLGEAGSYGYPMYWSNGDKISVNGKESIALTLGEEQTNVVDFTFDSNLSTPYCVTYPAAAEGKVEFAANQSHAGNTTFGDNVATMWGYSENGEGVTLKHLTGVIKIGVVVDEALVEKKLVYAQVSTIDRTPIAGAFNFDFENGVLGEPAENASEFINYSFGQDGILLDTALPAYLHLVVPAGTYDELYVTLYDEDGGVMHATIKASDKKPLAAGKVREFKTATGEEQLIKYAPTESLFVVDSVDKLFELAAGGVEKDVLFVKDIDMADDEQGRAWAPIENYAGKVLGNGHSIKGLTAPLFGVTTASIKGLHLKDVVLASNEQAIVAGLACQVLATDTTQPTIEHCSVSGTLTVNNTSYAPASANSHTGLVYAGVVGYAKGAIIDHCVSNVAITVNQSVNSSTNIEHILHLAGVVSAINLHKKANNDILYSNVSNCTNNGAIYVEDVAFASAETGLCAPRVAGVISLSYDANAATVSNCTNNAPITVKNLKSHTIKTAMIGGVISYATAIKASNLTSTRAAKITIEGGIGNNLYTAPISSYCQWSEWSNINNYADIEVSAAMSNNLYVAGLLACVGHNDTDDHYYADNLLNEGKVTVNGYGKSTCVAGVIGRGSQGDISDSINKGEVTLIPNSNTNSITVDLGGFEAVGIGDTDAGLLENCKNTGTVKLDITGCNKVATTRMAGLSAYCHHFVNNCENTGTVLVTGSGSLSTNNDLTDSTTDSHYNIGGLSGYKAAATGGAANSVNRGDIIFEPTLAAVDGVVPCVQVGGLTGRTHQPFVATCNNYGNVIVRGDTSASTAVLCVGGTTGITHGETKDGHTNAGNIYVSGKHTSIHLGGCVGMNSPYSLSVIKNATNSGNIFVGYNENGEEVATTFTTRPTIGGCVGNCQRYATNLNNNGNIHIKATINDGTTLIGGVVGCSQTKSNEAAKAYDGLTNTGKMYIGGSYKESFIGGCLAYNDPTSPAIIKNVTNSGNIYVGFNENEEKVAATFSATPRIAGCIGNTDKYFTNINNSGNIRVNATVASGSSYISGCVALANTADLGGACTGLTNTGNISYEGAGYGSGNLNLSGCVGYLYGNTKTNTNITNSGNITFKASASSPGKLYIGGAANYLQCTVKDITNNGKISILSDNGSSVYVGGVFSNPNGYNRTNLVNNGEIYMDAKGGSDCFIGGLSYELQSGNNMVWKNCHNYGDITLTSKCQIGNTLSVGGLISKYSTANQNKIFEDCSNSGDITVSALVKGKGCYAGLIGYLGNDTAGVIIRNSFVNNGTITYAGSTDGKDNIFVGGVVGDGVTFTNGTTAWTGNVINNGDLIVSGISKGGAMRVGGIIAHQRGALSDVVKLYNYGKIEVTGNAGAGAECIGGIVGESSGFPIYNATVNCEISAIGRKSIGMIFGMERTDTVKATNCSVAGTIDKGEDSQYQDEFGETITGWHSSPVPLTADNFHKYIYSVAVDASVATGDGCSFYVAPTTDK